MANSTPNSIIYSNFRDGSQPSLFSNGRESIDDFVKNKIGINGNYVEVNDNSNDFIKVLAGASAVFFGILAACGIE